MQFHYNNKNSNLIGQYSNEYAPIIFSQYNTHPKTFTNINLVKVSLPFIYKNFYLESLKKILNDYIEYKNFIGLSDKDIEHLNLIYNKISLYYKIKNLK